MKILLISYYFPPCGGAPVQRWLRFIPRLLDRGMKITVLCSKNGDYPFLDETLLAKIPGEVKVIRASAPKWQSAWQRLVGKGKAMPHGRLSADGGFIYNLLIWLRLNLIVPDLRVFWNGSALRAARRELKANPHDLLITTGPPHSSHLLGLELQKEFSLAWYADFRDPWSSIHYLRLAAPSRLTLYLHKCLESKVLRQANGALVVSQAIANQLPPGKKHIILNGFDPRDFLGTTFTASEVFRIKYVGQLTAGQDPRIFMALCRLLQRDYRLSLIGTKMQESERQGLIQASSDRVEFTEFMSHRDAIREMVEADLLLLIVNDYEGNCGMLTTKLFEYLASRTPVLCFSPPSSAAAQILMTFKQAKVMPYSHIEEAAAWIDSLPFAQRNEGNIDLYSVDNQADKLIELISG